MPPIPHDPQKRTLFDATAWFVTTATLAVEDTRRGDGIVR
jgi:hypothetical protein